MSLRFIVPGEPVAWQRTGRGNGTGHAFNPTAMRNHEKTVAQYADLAIRADKLLRGQYPASGHFWIGCAFYQGTYKRKFKHATIDLPHDSDLSNLIKLVEDALRGVVYHDDKQIRGYVPGTKKVLGCYNPHTVVVAIHENEINPDLIKTLWNVPGGIE